MQCAKCEIEMEKGFLSSHGGSWMKANSLSTFFDKITFFLSTVVVAWKCPQCNKIELYLEKK